MSNPKNVIVAQSGGPTPVINASLRGVVEACQAYPDTFGTVFAGFHGIEGVLKEELLNLSAQPTEDAEDAEGLASFIAHELSANSAFSAIIKKNKRG